MKRTIICPECNIEHNEIEIPGHNAFGYNCPMTTDNKNELRISRFIQEGFSRWQIPNIKRKFMLIIEEMFDDEKQEWNNKSYNRSYCCRQMKNASYMAHRIEIDHKTNQVLYDPTYMYNTNEDFNGTPITTCPFCRTTIEIVEMVRKR